MLWDRLAGRIRNVLEENRARREFRQLQSSAPQIAAAIARDAGLSPLELASIASAGRHAATLRERMLEAFGIRSDKLSTQALGALRETGVACSHCRSKRRCAIELDRGTARANAAFFCPNAPTFEALVAEARR